jgi:hypothetical protein
MAEDKLGGKEEYRKYSWGECLLIFRLNNIHTNATEWKALGKKGYSATQAPWHKNKLCYNQLPQFVTLVGELDPAIPVIMADDNRSIAGLTSHQVATAIRSKYPVKQFPDLKIYGFYLQDVRETTHNFLERNPLTAQNVVKRQSMPARAKRGAHTELVESCKKLKLMVPQRFRYTGKGQLTSLLSKASRFSRHSYVSRPVGGSMVEIVAITKLSKGDRSASIKAARAFRRDPSGFVSQKLF